MLHGTIFNDNFWGNIVEQKIDTCNLEKNESKAMHRIIFIDFQNVRKLSFNLIYFANNFGDQVRSFAAVLGVGHISLPTNGCLPQQYIPFQLC